jgi:4-amino-4-deoxy-L-arabinose transferase-like glycosyltransferase
MKKLPVLNSRWLIPLAIVLCAFALRVHRLGWPSLHGDEAFSAQLVAQPFGQVIAALGRYEPNPPLYYTLLWLWIRLAGMSEFALRFLSAWWGVLLIPWAYDLGRRLGGAALGATTALLVAVSPFLIWHSQEGRMYALLATVGLASVTLLARALQSGRLRLWWAWAAATWLALFTHYFAAFLALAQVLALIAFAVRSLGRGQWTARLKAWAVPLSVAVLLSLPWVVYVAPMMLAHEKSWILPAGLGEFIRQVSVTYSLGSTAAPWAIRWLWPGFLLIFAAGVVTLTRRQRWTTAFIGSCLLVPLAVVYLLSLRRPMFHERYLIFVLPLYLLFLASGVVAWARWIGTRSASLLGVLPLAYLLGASGLGLFNYFYHPDYAKSPPWREMVHSIQAQSQPGDIVIQNYPDPSLTYYLADRLPHTLVPGGVPFSQPQAKDALTDLTMEHRRLWLVPSRSADWDATGLVETWLDRHGDLVDRQQFGSLRLRLYLSPAAFLEPGPPLARLSQTVQLLDYRLTYQEGPVRPGDLLHLSLYWQTDEPLAVSYKVFAHLLDPTGWIRGQQDNPPVEGTYPTTEWQPGEVIVDRYEIPVASDAPPGRYRLAVGMYDSQTLERLPVQDVFCEDCPVPAYDSKERIFLPVEIPVGGE